MTLVDLESLDRRLRQMDKDLDQIRLDMKFMRSDISHGRSVDLGLKGDIDILEVRVKGLEDRKTPLKI